MVSDQCQALERDGCFGDSDDRKMMKIREPKDNTDIVPGILREGAETVDRKFEMEFFLLKMEITEPKDDTYDYGILKVHEFPNINRGVPCAMPEYRGYLKKYANLKPERRFADFNFLVFLVDMLGVETSCAIGMCVANEDPVPS